jgi:hypothetical protein
LSFHRSPESLRARQSRIAPEGAERLPATSLELASFEYFCKGVGGELGLDDLLGLLARRVRRILPAETCVVYLRGSGGCLIARAADGLHAPRIEGMRLPWGRGLSGWAAANQKQILNGDPGLDLGALSGSPPGLTDALVVPLSAGGAAIGVVAVYAELARSFGSVHLEIANEIARAASGIVDRARYREGLSAGEVSPEGESRTHPASHFSGVASALVDLARDTGRTLSIACIDFETPGSLRPLGIKEENRPTRQRIAALIRAELPHDVSLFNFGEHRLVAVFQGLDRAEAQARGHRLQVRVRGISLSGQRGPAVACQVAVVNFPEDGTSVKALLDAAERRLAGMYVPEREKFLRVRQPPAPRKPAAKPAEKVQH